MSYAITTSMQNAGKMKEWIEKRGGIAVWNGINLSNLRELLTPAKAEDGAPYSKPSWDMPNEPTKIVTDPAEVCVTLDKEVRRFHIAIRRSGNGLSLKLTDASSEKVRRAVEKAGDGAYYLFDHDTQDAVIMKPEKSIPLTEYAEAA